MVSPGRSARPGQLRFAVANRLFQQLLHLQLGLATDLLLVLGECLLLFPERSLLRFEVALLSGNLFLQRGVPSADIIDLEYGYNNVFWHTPQDTVDKLSPKSLAIVGAVTLETVRMLDQR